MRVSGSCFDDNGTDLDGLCLVARGVGVEGLEGLLASTTHDHDLRWSGASEARQGVGRRTTVQATNLVVFVDGEGLGEAWAMCEKEGCWHARVEWKKRRAEHGNELAASSQHERACNASHDEAFLTDRKAPDGKACDSPFSRSSLGTCMLRSLRRTCANNITPLNVARRRTRTARSRHCKRIAQEGQTTYIGGCGEVSLAALTARRADLGIILHSIAACRCLKQVL